MEVEEAVGGGPKKDPRVVMGLGRCLHMRSVGVRERATSWARERSAYFNWEFGFVEGRESWLAGCVKSSLGHDAIPKICGMFVST